MALRRLAEDQPESFAFTPENAAWCAEQIRKYPPGRQASAVIPILWRGAGAGRLDHAADDRRGRPDARHGVYPRARSGDLLHHVQPAPGGKTSGAGLHDDAVLVARFGRHRCDMQKAYSSGAGRDICGRRFFLGRDGMSRRLRECAHGADRQRPLRGSRFGEDGEHSCRLSPWGAAKTGTAIGTPFVRAHRRSHDIDRAAAAPPNR